MVKWSTGPFVIGGMLQENQDDADTLDESGVFASLAYTQGQHVLKAQVGQLDNDASAGAYEKESTLALGYDHKLSNNTLWFAYFNRNQPGQCFTLTKLSNWNDFWCFCRKEHQNC